MGVSPLNADTESGVTEVISSVEMENGNEFEMAGLDPATGIVTDTFAVPAVAMRELGTFTVSCVAAIALGVSIVT